jgi:integrase
VNHKHGRLKTKNADRLVPIHSAILQALLQLTKGKPARSNLWNPRPNSSGVYSAALSKRLNTVLDNACPEDDKLVTYSLRHIFATRLKYADVQDSLLDEVSRGVPKRRRDRFMLLRQHGSEVRNSGFSEASSLRAERHRD